jgi:pyruvate dehydrogenase E1 component alpha subunit/2-oxoisovalerate dehydrogenase E1 component alpha subunit
MVAASIPEPEPAAEDPTLGLLRVIRDDGRTDPSVDPFVAPDVLLAIYREMRRLRILDTRMVQLQRQGRIGFYGTCTGQEAPPIATAFATEHQDWIFPALRGRDHARASSARQVRGADLRQQRDLRGRQMPSHERTRSQSGLVVELHRASDSAGGRCCVGGQGAWRSIVTIGSWATAPSEPDFTPR